MKSASLSEIKKELKSLTPDQVFELCMRLAKYKKDNKELLNYLLFEAQDESSYISAIKAEMDEEFESLNKSNLYLAKKTIRKVLRTANKHIKYSGSKQTEVEILIHFCKTLKQTGIPIRRYVILQNLYESQIKKIQKALSTLHEDVQGDYEHDLKSL
jgi:hypothetical protein